jgi:hypothetical protein
MADISAKLRIEPVTRIVILAWKRAIMSPCRRRIRRLSTVHPTIDHPRVYTKFAGAVHQDPVTRSAVFIRSAMGARVCNPTALV